MTDRPTLQQAARDALTVQTACNICGVAQSFARAMLAVMDDCHAKGLGTDAVLKHPVTILFADKIAYMVGEDGLARYSQATAACERMIEEEVEA